MVLRLVPLELSKSWAIISPNPILTSARFKPSWSKRKFFFLYFLNTAIEVISACYKIMGPLGLKTKESIRVMPATFFGISWMNSL